jgi:hypothetical protein
VVPVTNLALRPLHEPVNAIPHVPKTAGGFRPGRSLCASSTPPKKSMSNTERSTALLQRVIIQAGLLILAGLLAACHSLALSRSATKAGIADKLKDASAIAGTFENKSTTQFGPQNGKLWALLKGREGLFEHPAPGPTADDDGDHVRISPAGPGLLEVVLLSQGKIRQTVRLPYSVHGNYLHLRHSSDFQWLPLGYRQSSSDTAVTGTKDGDLVVLSRFDVSGVVMLIGSAGDNGTLTFRFPRIAAPR